MLAESVNLWLLTRCHQCFDITPTVAVRCLHQALQRDGTEAVMGPQPAWLWACFLADLQAVFLLLSGFCFVLLERHFAASISLPFFVSPPPEMIPCSLQSHLGVQ